MSMPGAEEQCHLLVFLQLQVHLLSYLGELAAPILIPEKVAFTHLHALLTPQLVILVSFCSHDETVTACLESSGPVSVPANALLQGGSSSNFVCRWCKSPATMQQVQGCTRLPQHLYQKLAPYALSSQDEGLPCYRLTSALRKGLLQGPWRICWSIQLNFSGICARFAAVMHLSPMGSPVVRWTCKISKLISSFCSTKTWDT
jgi:hypothetical protein